ncbi:MAG: (deoxy)nucleoside triphosphate pyrophosphohydrolase [Clostridiaceae bacterium]|nr:(deoxy)nucleoside triphosphate pyrophosphohydrolase [Clostridiaceae bacterium]
MKEIHVVGAAITDGNLVLAAQRSDKMKLPLKWEFPGGKIEKNETHQQALMREIYEELGVRIRVDDFLADGYSIMEDKKIILFVYNASIVEGIPKAKEHTQLKWVEIDKILELDWAEADYPVCKELLKILKGYENR